MPDVRELTANDVSVLFPLSEAGSALAFWPPTLEGKGGPLLPLSVYEQLPDNILPNPLLPRAEEYELLRVVGVRFDPCFGEPCRRQIRLVLQGFMSDGIVFDGAAHLLYNLTDAEFLELTTELRELNALAPENTPSTPLGPSPAIEAQGVDGAYATALRELVTHYAGTQNLARITFMTRSGAGTPVWSFGGLNLEDFEPLGTLALPGLPPDTELQHLTQAIGLTYGYAVLPEPVHLAALMPVIGSDALASAADEERSAGYAALTRVENPKLESPDTADCVSCHVANFIRGYLDENYPTSAAPETTYSGLAAATRAVGEAETNVSNLRAFGYFATGPRSVSPAISQRTANETHHVLELFEAL